MQAGWFRQDPAVRNRKTISFNYLTIDGFALSGSHSLRLSTVVPSGIRPVATRHSTRAKRVGHLSRCPTRFARVLLLPSRNFVDFLLSDIIVHLSHDLRIDRPEMADDVAIPVDQKCLGVLIHF